MTSPALHLLRLSIADKLCEVNDIVGKDYVLTLIARHKTNQNAHIIVTADDTEKAIEAVRLTPE